MTCFIAESTSYRKGTSPRDKAPNLKCEPGQAVISIESNGQAQDKYAYAGRRITVWCTQKLEYVSDQSGDCWWTTPDEDCKRSGNYGVCFDTVMQCPGGVVSGIAAEERTYNDE